MLARRDNPILSPQAHAFSALSGKVGQHRERSSLRAFALFVRAQMTQLTGQCRGRTHIPMALCGPRRRGVSQRPPKQAMHTDKRLAHDTGA